MLESLKVILDVQEVDMKLIRLMRLKDERKKELTNINSVRTDLEEQMTAKEAEIKEIKKDVKLCEVEIAEARSRTKKLEEQQDSVKKIEEFNALSQELNTVERGRAQVELRMNELGDKLVEEETLLERIKESCKSTEENCEVLEDEINQSIGSINEEGKQLMVDRKSLAVHADKEVFVIYERLLRNRKDRVVVPIEDRACSGCYIMLTAQHENLVRKGERLVFCEYCSRVLYWPESQELEDTGVSTRRRRRRTTAKS
jgi:uncharacterized protein